MPNFNFSITGKGQLQVWFWPKKDKSQILLTVNNQYSKLSKNIFFRDNLPNYK